MSLSTSATLGGIAFHGWRGWIGSIQNVVDIFGRIGEAGSGHEVVQTRSTPVSVSAWIACSSAGNAITAAGSVETLSGTVVALTDPWSRSISRVRVTGASCSIVAGKGTEISAAVPSTHIVKCEFTIERLP